MQFLAARVVVVAVSVSVCATSACIDARSKDKFGSVSVSVTGGTDATEGLLDGRFSDAAWTASFDHATYVMSDVAVDGAALAGPFAIDVSRAPGVPPSFALQTITDVAVGAREVQFHVAPGMEGATPLGGIAEEELAALDDAGASIHLEGALQNPGADEEDEEDDVIVGIDWYLPASFAGCVPITVQDGGVAQAIITFDVQRAFAKSMDGEAELVFSNLQSLAGADAIVDSAELADAIVDTGVYSGAADEEEDMLSYVARSMGQLGLPCP